MIFIRYALCSFLLASSSFAYADAVLSGSVSVNNPNTGTTSASGSGPSVSIYVNDPSGAFSSIVGNVGLTAGTVVATDVSEFIGPPNMFVTAADNYSVAVNGTYILTGGTGLGLANWTVNGFTVGLGPANWSGCNITLNGDTQSCAFSPGTPATGSFIVPFNTLLDLSFGINYSGFVSFADGHQSTLSYSFGVSPVPEPGTAALFSTGLLLIAGLRTRVVRIFAHHA